MPAPLFLLVYFGLLSVFVQYPNECLAVLGVAVIAKLLRAFQ